MDSDLETQILATAKLQPISETCPGDIFIAGYPRSGNTWMQYLIAGVMLDLNPRLAPDPLVQSLVPDVHLTKFYKRFGTPTFFKTHHLPQPEYRRVIYLVRDGRDAIISYFHFLAALGEAPDFLKLVTTGEGLFPCRWHEHIEAWLANPHGAEMMIIRYESLKQDIVGELKRISQFAGLERDRSMLERIAQNSTFAAMSERERKLGWQDAWPKDKAFVRRGIVGSFRDEMPEAVLEAFMKSSMPALKRLDYL
ncbi:MAG TPA: sulfotransferase domain-containing protein [Chthoniobacterales bacterium]|nr:sulfotransferase domain-containing protein [Chthoniobacterales bacterium]